MARTDIDAQVAPLEVLAALGWEAREAPVRVTGGWDTLLWRFRDPQGGQHALRVHYLPLRDELARRERIALEVSRQANIPAPRVEAFGAFHGLPVLILSWCEGVPMLSLLERRPWRIWALSREFGRVQARIHRVVPPAEFLRDAPADWIRRSGAGYQRLADHVASLRPVTSSLVHMDYHPLNLISDGRRVSGVIDWTYAAAGDPRADLARTAFTLLSAPLPPGPLRVILGLMRGIVLRGWRSGYVEAAGKMPAYEPFMAWAGATLLAEVELVVGKPQVWGTERDVAQLRLLVDRWARRTVGATYQGSV